MALKNDSFFSLSKSERRATLLLIIILLILTGARIAQYYYHSREKVEVTMEYESFQSELEEFNRSLNHQNEKAKNATPQEKAKLKEQYMQMKKAKNKVPDFVNLKNTKNQ